eukprot:CAMPEP_0194518168 /NCGR_PEP_ID=MMETSP0253-20130528/51526_1 /TAXON_ID=2966 /ORGANISM="Noctiluca scintillans" /LENGTH=237 /DNA_ID=CAMNT_0039362195 /DNA_START=22 /DNA_END=731 /DNA_ORIENTATION=-
MTSLDEEAANPSGAKIKEMYFDILNCKGNTRSYEESDNEAAEQKHVRKLNRKRAKELRKQQKKIKDQDARAARGEDNSDEDIPFFMQDASIRAAMRAREAEAKAAKKRKRKEVISSSSDDSSSASKNKKRDKKKKKQKKEKSKKAVKKKTKKSSAESSSELMPTDMRNRPVENTGTFSRPFPRWTSSLATFWDERVLTDTLAHTAGYSSDRALTLWLPRWASRLPARQETLSLAVLF